MITPTLLTFDVMSNVKSSEDIRREFGRYMQTTREEKGLSQKFVAGKIGKTVTQLSRIENGHSGTERDTVIDWARAVGVNENDALRKFKPENNLDDDSLVADGLFDGYYELPEERRRIARKAIAGIIRGLQEEEDE